MATARPTRCEPDAGRHRDGPPPKPHWRPTDLAAPRLHRGQSSAASRLDAPEHAATPSDRDRPTPAQCQPMTPSPQAATGDFSASEADAAVAAPADGWARSRRRGPVARINQAAGKGRHQQRLGARDRVPPTALPSHTPRPAAAQVAMAASPSRWPAAPDQRRAEPWPPNAGASPRPPWHGRGGWVGHWAARRLTPATTSGPAAEGLGAADQGTPTPPLPLHPKGPTPMPTERDHY